MNFTTPEGIIVILLSIYAVITSFALTNLVKKLENQEESVEEADVYVTNMEDYVTDIKLRIENTYTEMKAIDTKGAFESDDEVGGTFKQLLELIELLNKTTDTK